MGIPLFSEKKVLLILGGEIDCFFFFFYGWNKHYSWSNALLQIPMSGAKMALTTLSVVRGRDLSNLSLCWVLMQGCVDGELQMSRQVLHNLSTFKLRSYQLLSHSDVGKRSSIFVWQLVGGVNFAPHDKRSYRCKVQHVVKQ